MTVSVEQKLYEAWSENRGADLTAKDICELVVDAAIVARIMNQVGIEAGTGQGRGGGDLIWGKSWESMVRSQRGELA